MLFRSYPPTATLSQLQEVTLLLNYVRTYLPVDRWDHEAIVKELRLDEDLVRKIETSRRSIVYDLMRTGLRFDSNLGFIEKFFGSHHEYMQQLENLSSK